MTRSCRYPLTRLDLLHHVAIDSVHPPRVPIPGIDVSPLYTIHQQPTRAYTLTTMFGEEIARIRKLGVQGVRCSSSCQHKLTTQLLFQALNFLNVVASGLMMWKALCLVTNSDSPIVVVLS